MHGVCACRVALSIMQSVPSPSHLHPAHVLPIRVQQLMAINARDMLCTHTLTLEPDTGQQSNLLVGNNPEAASTYR